MELKDIKNPSDIRGLSIKELEDLCQQMRKAILYRTSSIGGHVGPNLGAVELITAIHYVFDTPKDKFVLDVSHQDFPHKMLTGRASGFLDKNDFDKVGEYTEPRESPEYDIFYAGHTSPALSLCTGLAKARELNNEDHRIVALVGDGSLSGGVAFEGLNTGAQIKGNFIMVFNDNQMAIAPNYGGIYPKLQELRETNGTADNNIFKSFGWDYVYLADGNDVEKCIDVLQKVKDSQRPVVVHVNTQKGEGYRPAEKYREKFHYSDPFEVSSGNPLQSSNDPDYLRVTREFLMDKLKTVPNLLILSSATPEDFGFYASEREKAGKHYMDVDIAEQTGVSVMAGAARGGAKVVYPIVATFMQRAYDQLIEDWAMDDSPALLPIMETGIDGIKDQTHLGFWDIPFITSIPEIIYLAPTNVEEYVAMLEWGLSQDKHKVAVRVPTYSFEHAKAPVDTDYSCLNQFKVVEKGSKVALIGAGDFFVKAEKVKELLKEKGINATLINPRFVSGVDTELLKSLEADHELVVTIEDGSIEGGFGQRVASTLGTSSLKVLNIGLAKEFADRYEVEDLERKNGLLAEQITDRILEIVK